jgi:hypothetical protein
MIELKKVNSNVSITVWEEQTRDRKNLPLINDEYISFLRNFDIVISTPTTMSLEVMMLDIPCIIDTGDDGIHITSPWHAMNNYLHLEDLFSIPKLRIAMNELEICNYIDELVGYRKGLQQYPIQQIIEFKKTFSANLMEFLKGIKIE